MDKRILVTDYPEHEISKDYVRALSAAVEAGFTVTVRNFSGLTEEETIREAMGYPVVVDIIHRWPARVIRALSGSLRLLARTGVGYDNVDIAAATECGVAVVNSRGLSGPAVAELAMGLLLCAAHRVNYLSRRMREGHFDNVTATQLTGATSGVVGYGAIGRQMAKLLRGFGCRVLVSSRTPVVGEPGVEWVSLPELLRESDFVSLHMPLTPETRGMIGKAELAMMKPTAFLINTARGAVVDEEALIGALQNGVIAGAGLDVLQKEPPEPDNPLLTMDNVVLTPHCASGTPELTDRLLHRCGENIVAFAAGEPQSLINPGYREHLREGSAL